MFPSGEEISPFPSAHVVSSHRWQGFSHQESGLWGNFPGEGKWFLGSLGGKKVLAQGWERQEGALFLAAFGLF